MKKILTLLLFALSVTTKAQLLVYNTYEDYVNKTGIVYEKFERYSTNSSGIKLIAYKDGEQKIVRCGNIYGYVLNDTLYRIFPKQHLPVRLTVQSGLCYYVSIDYTRYYGGTTVTTQSAGGEKKETRYSGGSDNLGGYEFVSETLSSELLMISKYINLEKPKKYDKVIEKLKEQMPAYSAFFDCVSAKMQAIAQQLKSAMPKSMKMGEIMIPQPLFKDCAREAVKKF